MASRWPLAAEAVVVALGLFTLGVLWKESVDELPEPVSVGLGELPAGLIEEWSGIYVGQEKIGHSVLRSGPDGRGGALLSERTNLRLILLGQPNNIALLSDVRLAADGAPTELIAQIRTEVQGLPVTLRAVGERSGAGMHIRLSQGGVTVSDLTLDSAPTTPATLWRTVAAKQPKTGESLSLPWWNPLGLTQSTMNITVLGEEPRVLPDGTQVTALHVRGESSGQGLEAWIAPDGRRVEEREESGLGMRILLETAEDALHKGWPEDEADAVDLIALSAVPVNRRIPEARSLRTLSLRVDGPESALDLIARVHGAAFQRAERRLTVTVPDPARSLPYLLPNRDRSLEPWTRATSSAPSDHPEIRKIAGDIVGDDLIARDAARKLEEWVHANIQKVPVAGFPHALEVLHSRRGDCNEHTTLYVALARALGLPARIAAGIVYTESIFEDGAFYYHAWPEVWLGSDWVPVDPTFGQFPADATHLKIVEGDLDQQMALMAVVGRLSLVVEESP